MQEPNVAKFELWRRDDNGNEFLVDRFVERAAAERRRLALQAGGHKQSYWIRDISGAAGETSEAPRG